MTDLYNKPLTMRERVLNFAKDRHYVSSIDLDKFKSKIQREEGNIPGILRISREARQLAEEGILRRLTKQEKIFRFNINPKLAIYEYVGEQKQLVIPI